LYAKRKREAIDEAVKQQIEAVMLDHLDDGHTQIAIQLNMGHHRIRRVMKKFGVWTLRSSTTRKNISMW
jgi:nicotinate-nucleotide pyrophosphorylase